jgi:predicted phage tail component-like protein
MIGRPRGPKVVIPGRAGFIHFDQPPGSRTITAECFIEGATPQERRDRFELLADWLDVQLQSPLILSDTADVFYLGVVEDSDEAQEWRDYGTFELIWEVQPYSYGLTPTEETWSSGVSETHNWDPEVKALVYPVIEITPTNGTLTSFDLVTNDDTLLYVGNVSNGATITINSIGAVVLAGVSNDVELTGAYDHNDLSMAGVAGQFPVLIPGTNSVQFIKGGGTATAITITVSYRKTYRK